MPTSNTLFLESFPFFFFFFFFLSFFFGLVELSLLWHLLYIRSRTPVTSLCGINVLFLYQ